MPLQYLDDRQAPAVYKASVAGGKVEPHEGNFCYHDIRITDGRPLADTLSLDSQGFRLVRQPSAVSDFHDDNQLQEIYESELRELVLTETGASEVRIFDHTRRSSSEAIRQQKQVREASAVIHNDYTDFSAPKRLREIFADAPADAERWLAGRFAIINVWRSTNGRVENFPLALCDATTVAPDELVPVRREARDRIGELHFARWNPDHQWYFFPAMEEQEALVFKTYDSADDGRCRFTIHTAFNDPRATADAKPRESIESRCFVSF